MNTAITGNYSVDKFIAEKAGLVNPAKIVLIDGSAEQKKALEADIKAAEESFEKAESESSKLGDTVDKAGSEINGMYIRQSEYRFAIESSKSMIEEQTARLAELRENSGDLGKKLEEYETQTASVKAEAE